MDTNGIPIFNPLEHSIHGHPLMVPAHEYNRLLALYNACMDDLRLIAETDHIDACLDPQRAVRVAQAAVRRAEA